MYPEARIVPAMKYWKLPAGKESMLSEVCENGEYFLQEKYDGFWYEYEKTDNHAYLFSRNKSVTTGVLSEKSENVPHIISALDCLPPNTIIIGEVYIPGGTSKDTTKIMGCLPAEAIKRQEKEKAHYYLFDIILYDGVNLLECGAEERYDILKAVWEKHSLSQYDFLRLAVKVTENLEEEISKILKRGGEGAVLKKKDAPYTPDKRPAWSSIKVKQMDTIDLICVGFCPPTKEYTGKDIDTWNYWITERLDSITETWIEEQRSDTGPLPIVRSPHYRTIPVTKFYYLGWNTAIEIGAYDRDTGKLFKLGTVSSGLTDADKQNMTEHPENYLNKVVSLDCMQIDKVSQTLRHPVFKNWRDDKNAQDCIIQDIFS